MLDAGLSPSIIGSPSSRYFAILVGISDYPGSSNDLNYCHSDVLGIRDLLASNLYFPSNQTTIFINSSATGLAIYNAVMALKYVTTSEDTIVFFYSGHGDRDAVSEYLVPYDGFFNPMIKDIELASWFNQLSFKRLYILIDACFSGGIIEHFTDPSVVGLSSCNKDELSYESGTLKHGVFTAMVIDAFTRDGNFQYCHDSDGDGRMDFVFEVFPFVKNSSDAYYLSYNITVTTMLYAANETGVSHDLDWEIEVTRYIYANDSRYLILVYEVSRTPSFVINVEYAPISYSHQNPAMQDWMVHLVAISSSCPCSINLVFLESGKNYAIRINASIQNWSLYYEYNPYMVDSDADGLSDGIEWDLHPYYDPMTPDATIQDHDGDGLSTMEEFYVYHTNPGNNDSDSDGMPDGWEVENGLDPLINDTMLDVDLDRLCTLDEYNYGTDPNSADTDMDGIEDGPEVFDYGTDHTIPDTDGDGFTDGIEILVKSDPLNPFDTPVLRIIMLSLFIASPFVLYAAYKSTRKRKNTFRRSRASAPQR